MRVVTWGTLLACPAGTVFCSLADGYADNLNKKGMNGGDCEPDGANPGIGFWSTELLPQRTGWNKRRLQFQPTTFWPSNGHDPGDVFYVLDPADVLELIKKLAGG